MSFLPSAAGTQKQKIKRPQAFTLIELLVVIAIIAILAGLLFPAGQSALNSAKKTIAKNQVVQIATAITAYETEYGRLPPGTFTTIDSTLVSILCTANDTVNNPRGLIFLEANAWKKGKGGSNSSGFCDPFGSSSAYSVKLDTNYANSLSLPTDGSGGSATMTKHVGVWTIWTNGTTKTLINSWE
ncbi:MAG: type II secretion system GspH family protein [Verrucomicrobia bacterium]|nr:type II secretion system GspH family protein [Verrucomicrobiota bacterium]